MAVSPKLIEAINQEIQAMPIAGTRWPELAVELNQLRAAAEAALVDAKPSGDNRFKIELAKRIVVRALTRAATSTPNPAAVPGPAPNTAG